jgi:hypothetical protein
MRSITHDQTEAMKIRMNRQEEEEQRSLYEQYSQQKDYEDVRIRLKHKGSKDIAHNTVIEGTIYKYDLPIENRPILFRNQLMVIDAEQDTTTPMMNLFDKLEMDKGKTKLLII